MSREKNRRLIMSAATMMLESPEVTASLKEWESWMAYLNTIHPKDDTLAFAKERAWRIISIKKELTTGI